MESDYWNWVTIPSDDLGALQSITVQRDNEGNGPDWFLDQIEVHSARFGTSGLAVFNRWIDTTSELSRSLLKFAERGGRASYPQFTAAQGIPT